MIWAQRYVGQKAKPTLKLNCLGYVRLILREQFRTEFPNFLGIARAIRDGKELPFKVTGQLQDGTMVICGNVVNPARHIGIYCLAADRVVHADTERGRVLAEPILRVKQAWPLVTFAEVLR